VIETQARLWLPRADLDRLITMLREDGRKVIGPTVRDAAIVYDEIESSADLPAGVNDRQAPGVYRIVEGADADQRHAFDFASSPSSWKAFTYPSRVPIARARREGDTISYAGLERAAPRMAFIGVRACDLAALGIHDDVLVGGPYIDEDYADRRGKVFIVAVECAVPSDTCFCASMGTGPEVTRGYDVALTELDDGFVVRTATQAGRLLAERLGLGPASPVQAHEAAGVTVAARAGMAERPGVLTDGLRDRLMAQLESDHWDVVGERCLACTNCTLVCPTCFCTNVTQVTDLLGTESTSYREWASCFSLEFARVAHGNFRPRVKDRYRQWLTHKFATWVHQFGTFGCVGCGRCITWCPVGIDVRAELAAVAPVRPPLERTEWPVPVSANPGRYSLGTIGDVWAETADTYTVIVRDLPEAVTNGGPGQFVMLDLPGYSAVPISIARYRDDHIYLTIRNEGASTRAVTSLRPGAQIGLRGPIGRGWPVEEAYGRDVVIVAGGIGLPPLRPLIDIILANRGRFGRFRLFYGARSPGDLLYTEELKAWARHDDFDVAVTVDRAKVGEWSGAVGVVTHLFDREPIDGSHTTAYVCGPEKMMAATSMALAGRGLLPERVFLSMERQMQCGIGLCGHCQMGKYFVCRDGPVFSRRDLGEFLDMEGL
jgi:NAD(P)H-flavin reductase/NAD-dependent dihydropyrimidine dehydrogenase PreA subunit